MSRRLVIDDGRSERELLVAGTMVVGRDPECEISSVDPRLSRRHAEFRATPTGVVVRDLGSRNGVRVNGRPISEAVLAPGDVISVAHLTVRYAEGDTAERRRLFPFSAAAADPAAGGEMSRPWGGGALGAVAARVAVAPVGSDDRTRVLPDHARGELARRPADLGEIVIRERPRDSAAPGASATEDRDVPSLLSVAWGRRVLVQGVLLALVVFLMTLIPLVAWQSRVLGVSAMRAWPALLPPLGAAAIAGALVAGHIARTAVREARRGGRR